MPIKIKRPTRIAANQRVTGKKILPYDPSYLFANGEAGVWYDPSDLSTMFQDAAGTIPVTGVEQPVGRILDKSGRGNHASQSTTARRPVLSARYNLLTRTEEFDNAVWAKGALVTISSNVGTDPLGASTADKLIETASNSSHYLVAAGIFFAVGTNVTFTLYAKASERSVLQIASGAGDISGYGRANFDLSNGILGTVDSAIAASITDAGNGWYRCTTSFTAQSTDINMTICIVTSTTSTRWQSYTGDGTSGIYIWGADLRVANEGSTLPPYQRVGNPTAGSSTAAGTADYDTNGFPPYLRFDGTDDSLETSNINFSATDKVTVFAGVRKLSDTFGIITEFGPSSASNNNSFHLGSDTIYGFFSRGTTRTDAIVSAASPRTDVLTGIGNVSGDNTILRLNGIQADIDAGDQGTGNYGTYPLYIGARGGTANRFNGRLYSLIVRGAETQTLDLLNTEKWVSRKTALPYTNNIENTVAREVYDRADALVFDRQDSVIIRRT